MIKKLKISNRSNIKVFRALDILGQVNTLSAQGIDIRRMGAGQPSVGAPQEALDYAIEMIKRDPRQGYTEAVGMPSLRERISQYYTNYYGTTVPTKNIVISAGSSPGLILCFLAAFDSGARVAMTTPTYPAYRNILQSLDLQTVEIESRAIDNYQPTLNLLQNCGQNFDGLIINSPSNPAGTLIDDTEFKKICAWCDEKGIRVISDEAYHGITYDRKAPTAWQFSQNTIITNTFSKYFAMTGWRMGWAVVPDSMIDRMKKLSESLFVSPPTISQHLAWKIFDHIDALDGYVATYARNREILMHELPKAGISTFTNAEGAFYVYADIHHLSNDSEEFCRRMLDEARVSTTPGTDFDLTRGNGTIRMCYADKTEDIIEACQRLKNWQS